MKSGFRMVTLLAALALSVACVPVQAEVSAPPGLEVRFTAPQMLDAHATIPTVAGAASLLAGVASEVVRRTRCKFQCEQVTPGYGDQIQVQLRAQYEPESPVPEDERFSRYTPCGSFEATIDNPALNGFFVPGKSYYLDITPAE